MDVYNGKTSKWLCKWLTYRCNNRNIFLLNFESKKKRNLYAQISFKIYVDDEEMNSISNIHKFSNLSFIKNPIVAIFRIIENIS